MTSCVPRATKFYRVTSETSPTTSVHLKDVFQRDIQSWPQKTAAQSPNISLGSLYQQRQHAQVQLCVMTTYELGWHQLPASDSLCLSVPAWRAITTYYFFSSKALTFFNQFISKSSFWHLHRLDWLCISHC